MCGICGLGLAAEVIETNDGASHFSKWPDYAAKVLADNGLSVADSADLFAGLTADPDMQDYYPQTGDSDPTGFSSFFDIPNGTGTNVFLGVGTRINAEVSVPGDTDWFRMSLTQGETYQISLKALPFFGLGDPELYLFDNNGAFLTFDDNSGEGLDSLLTVTATRTGIYYVGATGFGGTASTTGGYEISLAQVNFGADTVGQTKNSAGTVAVDSSVNGTIDFGTDQDWYEVTVERGKTYAVFLDSAQLSFTPLNDPKLEVVDRGLNLVAANDDNGITRNAALTFTADYNGKYYIKALGGPANTGDFTLTVADFSPPEPPSPLDAIDWNVQLDDPNVTYYFATQGETFMDELTDSPWSSYQKQQARDALAEYSKISLLSFSEVLSPTNADFILTKNFLDSSNTGRMIPPDPQFDPIQGIGWFNTNPTFWSDANGRLLDKGAFGYGNFIHEFGHGLGLSHPHDDGGGTSAIMSGVINAGTRGDFGLNSRVFTVMSYIDGWPGSPTIDPDNQAFGFPRTPMAFDIAKIQEKYGVNTTHNSGNDTYTLFNVNGIGTGTGYEAIWDTGGRDKIVHTGSMGATIDLREATLKSEAGGGGFVSFATGIHGGFTIANGVRIEDATGGSANDTLVGNRLNNRLDGKGGDDVMIGGRGNDTYRLNSNQDVVTETANGGTDTVTSSNLSLDLTGFDFVENARLLGSSNRNITGSEENNALTGNSGKNTISGGDGRDVIEGGLGKDKLNGQSGADVLKGGNGRDIIKGGTGKDRLEGQRQDDVLVGNGGADKFIFRGRIDSDVIKDFRKGQDELHLSEKLWAGTLTEQAVINRFAEVVNGDVVFDFGAGQMITLDGVGSLNGLVSDIVLL